MYKQSHNYKKNKYSVLIFLVLIILVILSMYSGFPSGNAYEQYPQQLKIMNVIKNDWYLNNIPAFNDRYFFNHFVVFFLNFSPNNPALVYLLIYLFFTTLTIFMIYKISMKLFNNQNMSFFISLFILIFGSEISLSAHPLIYRNLIPQVIALSFIVTSLYTFLNKRYILSYFLIGLAALFHLLLGFQYFGILFLVTVFNQIRNRKFIVKQYLYMLPFIIISLVNIIPLIYSGFISNIYPNSLIFKIFYDRLGHHYFPLNWSLLKYAATLGFFTLFLFVFKHIKIDDKIKRIIKDVLICLAIYFIIGFIFIEIIPILFVLESQIFRSLIFLYLICYFFIGAYIYKSYIDSSGLRKLAYILSFFIFVFEPLYIFNPLILFIKKYIPNNYDQLKIKWNLIALLAFFVLAFIIGFILFKSDFTFKNIILKVLYVLIIYFVLLIYKKRTNYKLFIPFILILIFLSVVNSYYFNPSNNEKVYDFISKNIPTSKILLTPPYNEEFRVKTLHPIVVDIKAFPLKEEPMVEWYNRINFITKNAFSSTGLDLADLKKGYNSLDISDIQEIKTKYNASYAVFEKPKALDLHIIYEDEKYIIYKIP